MKSFLYELDKTTTVATITLNRPERLNALTFEVYKELRDKFRALDTDEGVRAIIITGAGRAFCAGLDLRDWGTPPEPGDHRHSPVGVGGQEFLANLMVHIRQTPQVVIAAVNEVLSAVRTDTPL